MDPATVGGPWGDTVEGVLTFRGSPTRSWHGEGPVPSDPVVAWRFPDDRMCSMTSISGEQQQWCGGPEQQGMGPKARIEQHIFAIAINHILLDFGI